MKEIGSEFWLESIPKNYSDKPPDWINIGEDQCLLLSGRTAIDYVLDDISLDIKCVYMPSYCCDSMLQPFLERDIRVDFYEVVFNDKNIEYIIDYEKPCDIFFATSYFGFSSTVMDSEIKVMKNRGVIVIEDITHRLLSNEMRCKEADYCIASIRKWFAVPSGGVAIKQKGSFSKKQLKTPSKIIETKIKAMKQKASYIFNSKEDNPIPYNIKEEYLDLYAKFNTELRFEYHDMEIDELSKKLIRVLDVGEVREQRCQNAFFLYNALKNNQFIKPVIDTFDLTRDCPLFYPIRVKSEVRAELRKYLTINEIYCPIHWPIPNSSSLNDRTKKIYEEELSLVCDQRYNIDDMARVVNKIEEFWRSL